jgi:hypothetical protein
LRGNSSIHGFAGRWGFKLNAIFAALLLAASAGVDVPMTAAAPVTDAPAAMVKTCRREIPCDPVMTRRPVVRRNQ